MGRNRHYLRFETRERLHHRAVRPSQLEGVRRVHRPLQYEVGRVLDESQGTHQNREGETCSERYQDR